ncbi:MAG TPA: hypothetical protein VFN35_30030 [Ktedonobacteraceae bacterium]|nr:hypothetical protein [Ktedonobacteraceae bacterium]
MLPNKPGEIFFFNLAVNKKELLKTLRAEGYSALNGRSLVRFPIRLLSGPLCMTLQNQRERVCL